MQFQYGNFLPSTHGIESRFTYCLTAFDHFSRRGLQKAQSCGMIGELSAVIK